MKKLYIIPTTEMVNIHLDGAVMNEGDPTLGGGSNYARSMDSNANFWEEEDGNADIISTNNSLWDE